MAAEKLILSKEEVIFHLNEIKDFYFITFESFCFYQSLYVLSNKDNFDEKEAYKNRLIYQCLRIAYVDGFCIRIRKLIDKSNDVISLRQIINTLEDNDLPDKVKLLAIIDEDLKKLNTYISKTIAHNVYKNKIINKQSTLTVGELEIPNIGDIEKALIDIGFVLNILLKKILNENQSFKMLLPPGSFAHLNNPFLNKKNSIEIKAIFNEIMNAMNNKIKSLS